MTSQKTYHSKYKFISAFIAIALIITASLLVNYIWKPTSNGLLSQSSLRRLQALNSEHEMVLNSLLGDEAALQADILQSNSFKVNDASYKNNQGLVVALDENVVDNTYLLLQPANATSEDELGKLAELYQSAIPEFLEVEVDQNVVLQTEPHYRVLSDEEVDLSNERYSAPENEETSPTTIAVIDSGLDPYHEVFDNVEIKTGWNTITGDTVMYDDVGHGTHIAGILASKIDNIEIVPYKIVDANGGRLSNVLEAFDKAIQEKPDIINASFGLMSPSGSLERIMEEAYQNDIIVVAAAGNNNSSRGFYPASYSSTLAVASLKNNGEAMDKSNYGEWVDIAAPGESIYSALPDNQYGYKSGTSQAAALVSARIAQMMQDENEEPWNLESVMQWIEERESDLKIDYGKLAGVAVLE